MIHKTRGDEPYDERDISISGNKVNERLTNLKGPLEKDGDSTTILAKDILQGNYESIIGRSPQIIEVLKQIDKVANTIAKVLICGETGTGKELIARALHQNSDRSGNKMVSVNCLDMKAARLRTRKHDISANLKEHTKARFSLMKSEICLSPYRQSCYGQLRRVKLNASVGQNQFPSMSGL